MRYAFIILGAVFLGVATTASGQLVTLQASHETTDADEPALASSPHGETVLAYRTAAGNIQVMTFSTEATDYLVLPDPVTLGPGEDVDVCWSGDRFFAAVSNPPDVQMYQSIGTVLWEPMESPPLHPAGAVQYLDLCAVPMTTDEGINLCLAMQTTTGGFGGDTLVEAAWHHTEEWWSYVAQLDSNSLEPTLPRATWYWNGFTHLPMVFYMQSEDYMPRLVYRIADEMTGWRPAVALPQESPFGSAFDVIAHGGDRHSILGMGMQATCPCNTIHHQEHDPALGWLPATNLTQSHGQYNWPSAPQLAADNAGRLHAFWYQESRAYDFTFLREHLFYFVREGEEWVNMGAEAFPQHYFSYDYGEDLALTAAPGSAPVLAWSRRDTLDGVPQPEQVFVTRTFNMSPVPGDVPAGGQARLQAWPNPFNPKVQIALWGEGAQAVQLDIFDARGRRMRRVFAGQMGPGRNVVEWDGMDDGGRRVPSGVYFARARVAGRIQTTKLVLTE